MTNQLTLVESDFRSGEKFDRLYQIQVDGRHIGTIARVRDNDKTEDEMFSGILTAIQSIEESE
jgi:hypothetical protein